MIVKTESMPPARTSPLLVTLLTLCLPGCPQSKNSLGDLPSSTGGSGDSAPETTGGDNPSESGPGPAGVGSPCQLSMLPETRLLEDDNADCASSLCVYPDEIEADSDQTCTEDAQCSGAGQGVICTPEGRCALDPAHVAAASRCTDTCDTEADCVGAPDTTCSGGFACVPVQAIGSVCCERLCICKDDFNSIGAEQLQENCEAGTQPGCCDQDPAPPACGG